MSQANSERVDDIEEAPVSRESAQSGLRPAPSLSERLDAALAASTRTEAALADVFRTTKFLTATIGALREANAEVLRELEDLATHLSAPAGDTAAAEHPTLVDGTEEEAARERERLLSEHDKFITMLMADHERELAALKKRFAELEATRIREVKS